MNRKTQSEILHCYTNRCQEEGAWLAGRGADKAVGGMQRTEGRNHRATGPGGGAPAPPQNRELTHLHVFFFFFFISWMPLTNKFLSPASHEILSLLIILRKENCVNLNVMYMYNVLALTANLQNWLPWV